MTFHPLYGLSFAIMFCFEVVIALFVHDNLIRPFGGDVLVILLLYCFCKMLLAKTPKLLPLYLFLFAVMVEISQYFHLVQLLHLENNILACVILGTSFSFLDIICYLVGSLLLVVWQYLGPSWK